MKRKSQVFLWCFDFERKIISEDKSKYTNIVRTHKVSLLFSDNLVLCFLIIIKSQQKQTSNDFNCKTYVCNQTKYHCKELLLST